jgi:hypothetical protein
MGDQEVAPERLAHALGQHLQGDGGGVGADRAARPAHCFQLAVQRLLDVGAFQHRFDNPVAIGQFAQIVFQVAGFDQLRRAVVHESRRFALAHAGDGALGQGVAVVRASRNDIQQHHGHAGIRHLGGDAGAHGAGADDSDAADHQTRSRIVAMP